MDILDKSTSAYPKTARRQLAAVNSLERFVELMPFLIAEAQRQYLHRGPIKRATAPPGSRMRLQGGDSTSLPMNEEVGND
jgi:hypothetical protein